MKYKPIHPLTTNPDEYQVIEIDQVPLIRREPGYEFIEDGAYVIIPPGGRMKDVLIAPTDEYSAAMLCSWFQRAYELGIENSKKKLEKGE